jgi:S1-C subfamily serine protease
VTRLLAVLAATLAAGLIVAFNNPASGGTSERAIVSKVKAGTVIISARLQYNAETAAGTGMVINSDGLVLTNNHVIENSASITATVPATGRTYQARVVGYDEADDIALIRLRGAPRLATVPVGNSSLVRAGQPVVALGNAGGRGIVSAAAGTVTGLNQTIKAIDGTGPATSETLHGVIKTNADIVGGDSGGPLSGPDGVIAMDTASGISGSRRQAVGFAIPINMALSVAAKIAAGKPGPAITIGYPPFLASSGT